MSNGESIVLDTCSEQASKTNAARADRFPSRDGCSETPWYHDSAFLPEYQSRALGQTSRRKVDRGRTTSEYSQKEEMTQSPGENGDLVWKILILDQRKEQLVGRNAQQCG